MTLIALDREAIGYNGGAVLTDVSLAIEEGQTLVFVGESGVGKSTLLSHLYRLVGRHAALIPQDLGLADHLSVFHNVYMGRLDQHGFWTNLRNWIWPAEPYLSDVRGVLKHLELNDKINTLPTDLSGGQRQRVAIGRALYKEASLLIADEPVSALDEKLGREVLELLTSKHRTCLIAMHDIDAATQVADRLIGLKAGKIVFDRPPEDISSHDMTHLYERA